MLTSWRASPNSAARERSSSAALSSAAEGLRLDDVLEHLSGLARPPLALTLAGMSFEKADSAQATQQLEVCLRLIGLAIESRG